MLEFNQLIAVDAPLVITIGSFDGLHLGHRQLLQFLNEKAAQQNAKSLVISFLPHPRIFFNVQKDFYLLNDLQEKRRLMDAMEIDYLMQLPFDAPFASQSAEEFVKKILAVLKPKAVVLGYDHKFGKNRTGSKETFEALHQQNSCFEIFNFEEQKLNFDKIDSTTIRNCIKKGEVTKANQLLGYDYQLAGEVVEGKKLGRTINFPTANLDVFEKMKLIPMNGVYKTSIQVQDVWYRSITNIGIRPTVSGVGQTIETHIFDFEKSIYGEKVVLRFEKFIRPEQKFESLDALKAQIQRDIDSVKREK
jgi:riboflavin kinase/FMN adenylyltransferase